MLLSHATSAELCVQHMDVVPGRTLTDALRRRRTWLPMLLDCAWLLGIDASACEYRGRCEQTWPFCVHSGLCLADWARDYGSSGAQPATDCWLLRSM